MKDGEREGWARKAKERQVEEGMRGGRKKWERNRFEGPRYHSLAFW